MAHKFASMRVDWPEYLLKKVLVDLRIARVRRSSNSSCNIYTNLNFSLIFLLVFSELLLSHSVISKVVP
jgi:hypothetical protein